MPADPLCTTAHYRLPAPCTLPAGHSDPWHRAFHPITGTELRFRTAPGVDQTQEWESYEDPGDPQSGHWVTWHYAVGPVSTVIVTDLDDRAAALVASCFPTSRTRTGPEGGLEEECACGQWYRAGRSDIHLGRQVSLMARSFFDMGLRYGQEAQLPD